MKKLKIIAVMFFSMLVVGGCSCTSSMCTEDDLNNIKESITNKWENNEEFKVKLREEAAVKDITDPTEIENYVNQNIQNKIETEFNSHPKACLTIDENVDESSGAVIEGKTWGDAFSEGLLEGLIVYPIAWLLISFTNLFGGSGFAKVASIIVATLIIKLVMLAFTFKSQIQTQKMQAIQPELNAISAAMKNPNITPSERNRLTMKMMDIYKKNEINPFATILPTFISLPIFLSVWSAVSQTMIIRQGSFLGIELGANVSTQVFSLNIGAIILFILMSGLQIFSMKLPNIIRKRHESYKTKQLDDSANKQMNTTMNIMIGMIIFTGFMLPAALAVYWAVGALFAIAQTYVFQSEIVKAKLKSLSDRKKKAKVVK